MKIDGYLYKKYKLSAWSVLGIKKIFSFMKFALMQSKAI